MKVLSLIYLLPLLCLAKVNEEIRLEKTEKDLLKSILLFEFSEVIESKSALYNDFLYRILKNNNVTELQLSISQGFWRAERFGNPLDRGTAPGVELIVSFADQQSEANWKRVVYQLNGLFCTAITVAGETQFSKLSLASPLWGNSDSVFYAAYTADSVCTENVESFKKLLPCQNNGIIRLLGSPSSLYETRFTSTSVTASLKDGIWANNVQFAFVNYNGKVSQLGHLFGRTLMSLCPVADETRLVTNNVVHVIKDNDLGMDKDLKLSFGRVEKIKPPVSFFSFTREKHTRSGKFVSPVKNQENDWKNVKYTHLIPWQLRVWFSSVGVECDNTKIAARINPKPGVLREKATLIEIEFDLPPNKACVVSYEFQKSFLYIHEYPPDANRGISVPGPVLTLSDKKGRSRFHAEPTLVMLPLPDSTMPFNVTCFVGTVAAFIFQIIFGATTNFPSVATDRRGLVTFVLDRAHTFYTRGKRRLVSNRLFIFLNKFYR